MRRIILGAVFLLVSVVLSGQNKFNLLPENMVNFVGVVDRTEFEKSVGEPVDEDGGFVVYEVTNTYDNIRTAIRCFYREADGKLISVKFGTQHFLGYWIGFYHLKGFPEKEATAERLGLLSIKKDRFGEIYQIDMKLKGFGCQILDITKRYDYTTALINYHIVEKKRTSR